MFESGHRVHEKFESGGEELESRREHFESGDRKFKSGRAIFESGGVNPMSVQPILRAIEHI